MQYFILSLICILVCLRGIADELSITVGQELSWSTSSGNTYQVQIADAPYISWSDLDTAIIGDGTVHSIYLTGGDLDRRFRMEETVPGQPVQTVVSVNGSFEAGNIDTFENWNSYGSQPPLRYSGDSFNGAYSMRGLLQNNGATPREGLLTQRIGNEGKAITPGESYNLSFYAKQVSSGPSFEKQYRLRWLSSSGQDLGGTGFVGFSVDGSSDWVERMISDLVAPSGAIDAEITFRFVTGAVPGGSGDLLIDAVTLGTESEDNTGSQDEINYLEPEEEAMVTLQWDSQNGISYQPSSSYDLITWTQLGPPIVGDGSSKEVSIARQAETCFYRLEYQGGSSPPAVVGEIVPLYSASTQLNAPITIQTDEALITRLGDRARDRHAREDQFQAYDHYLSWYWEERTMDIEIIDRVAVGGTDITFNYETLTPLGAAEFRAFFRGLGTVAEYHFNAIAEPIGENRYTATLTQKLPEERPLQLGDRVEIEISQFLLNPQNGRNNYYGTAVLYIVGQGIVPWQAIGSLQDSYPLPEEAWLGGLTTLPYQYSDEPDNRFKQTAGNISPDTIQDFMLGRRLHHTNFSDGSHSEPGNPIFTENMGKLGPQFITPSCVSCHTNNGRSLPPNPGNPLINAVISVGSDSQGSPHGSFGSVLQAYSTAGYQEPVVSINSYSTINGQYGDGTSYSLRKPNYAFSHSAPDYYSVRLAQQLVGLGLLEAVDESTISALADPEDTNGDGISGRMRRVTDPETGEVRLGRFTYKSAQSKIKHQIASALNTDMGVNTNVYPTLDDGSGDANSVELSDDALDKMTKYVALLGVSAKRDLGDAQVIQGETLFNNIGCADCHIPSMTTGSFHPLSELRNQTIHPYTDLLLHDMGPDLADTMGEPGVDPSEWRTPPLWSIGLTAGISGGEAYLHDGRARTLEEAILWHGGEGENAKEAFRTLSAANRAALIEFLKSL